MCEPFHSITQFPALDDEQDSIRPQLEAAIQLPIRSYGLLLRDDTIINVKADPFSKFGVEIDEFINYSKMGLGHSESLEGLAAKARMRLPQDTRYETAWWERKVRIDGAFYGGPKYLEQQALQSAKVYAELSSIGNLSIFRRFLETTVRKTEKYRRFQYFRRVLDNLVNAKGREILNRKLQAAVGGNKGFNINLSLERLDEGLFERCISAMLGITRKRELLVPEWADDDSLWVKKSKGVLDDVMSQQIINV